MIIFYIKKINISYCIGLTLMNFKKKLTVIRENMIKKNSYFTT